jgi:hypothetical protein
MGSNFGVFSQEFEKRTKFSPEFKLSFNLPNKTLLGGYGFGIGLHNAFFNQKRCNLIIGLEYNAMLNNDLFRYGSKSLYNYIGIPVNVRVNLGKKVKFFVEAGAFFDPIVFERIIEEYITITEKTVYMYKPDFGISGGVGLRIPIKKYEILVKSDYKWGLRSIFDRSSVAFYNRYWRLAVGFKM